VKDAEPVELFDDFLAGIRQRAWRGRAAGVACRLPTEADDADALVVKKLRIIDRADGSAPSSRM